MYPVSLSPTVRPRDEERPGTVGPEVTSPLASRQRTRRWADPRLWAGALLVLTSILVGAAVLSSADSTEPVWRLSRDVPSGSPLVGADLERTLVHLDDSTVQLYLSAEQPLEAGVRVTRDLRAGELLAASAISADTSPAPQLLPLGVPGAGVPAGLAPGDRVDVWAVASLDDRSSAPPSLVLRQVAVSAVSAVGPGGLDSDRQILVELPDGTDVARALSALNGASVVLVEDGT
jgi:hypothetical protein